MDDSMHAVRPHARAPRLHAAAAVVMAVLAAAPAAAQQHRPKEEPMPASGVRIGPSRPGSGPIGAYCVDAAQPAWTLVYTLSVRDVKTPCAHPDMRKVPARDAVALARRLQQALVHEVSPDAKVVERVMQFVRQMPGSPIGLTFDGGMAVTANDYTTAEQRYAAWKRDPKAYARRYWAPQP